MAKTAKKRAPRGTVPDDGPGSKREIRPDVWELRLAGGWDEAKKRYRTISRTYYGSERGAIAEKARLFGRIDEGKEQPDQGSFGALLDKWLALAGARLAASTYRGYAAHVELLKSIEVDGKPLGKKPLKDLTAFDFEVVYDLLANGGGPTGKRLSARTIERVNATARAALNAGVRWKKIPYNPTKGAVRLAVHKSEVVVPSVEEFQATVAAAGLIDEDMAVMLVMFVVLGGRRSELCGLRWRDVYDDHVMARRVITVETTKTVPKPGETMHGTRFLEKDPKAHAVAPIPISPVTKQDLDDLYRRRVKRAADEGTVVHPDGFVFSHEPDCMMPLNPEWVSDVWDKSARSVGLDLPLKQTRAANATWKLGQGVPAREVSQGLRHKYESTTTDFYSGSMPGALPIGPGVIDALLGRSLKTDVVDELNAARDRKKAGSKRPTASPSDSDQSPSAGTDPSDPADLARRGEA